MGVVVTAARTEISNCNQTTGWSGGTIATNDAFNLEGTFCLGEKVSQTLGSENVFTFAVPGVDMTDDFIVIPMQVTGTPETIANGGFRIVVEDGIADRGVWYVGGSDTTNEKWSYFVVDPATAPTYLNGTLNSDKAITSLTQSGTTATCTTTAVHGLITGDYAVIDNASNDAYNGSYSVTVSSTTVFTYTMNSAPGADATGLANTSLKQGINFTDVDIVGVQFNVVTKSVGNTPNALWDICWYGQGLKVTSTIDSVTLTRSGTTVTVASTGHGLVVGDKIRVSGAVQTDYNGDWTIDTVPGVNSYTYEVATTPTSPATGTITSRVHATWQHLADASAAGFWGLVIQTQGVNFIQGRFTLGSNGGAGDLLFVDDGFKVIFRENAFLKFVSNNILPAKDIITDTIDIEMSNGLISAFNTQWAWDYVFSDFEIDTMALDGLTIEGARVFNADTGVTAHTYTNITWNNCILVDPRTSEVRNSAIRNSPSDGLGMLWPGTSNNVIGMQFSNNPFGVTITQVVDQTFDNFVFEDVAGQSDVLFTGATDIDINNINGSNANSALEVGAGVVTFVDAPVTTQYTVVDVSGTPISGARVFLESSTFTGPLPYEATITIVQAAGVATVTHPSHNIPDGTQVVIRGVTQNEYNKVAVITVVNANSYTYAVDSGAVSPATGAPKCSGVLIHGTTNGSGVISDIRPLSTDQPFKGTIRASSGSPYYQALTVVGTSSATAGFAATATLQPDE
jgi:hypothetical protein